MIAFLAGPLGRLIAMAVLAAGLAGWALLERSEAQAADERAAAAQRGIVERDAALENLKAQHNRQVASLEQAVRDSTRRAATYQPVGRAIDATPRTNACAASGAVRALVVGMRALGPTDPGRARGAAGGAQQPAVVPAAP